MRILLSSVGRRGYLVRYFRDAVTAHDEVWGGDCNRYASAFHYCDNSVLLPEVTDPDYAESMLELCRRCSIDMLVPLIDPELEVLARHRQRFLDAGVMAVVSPLPTIEMGYDKYLTYRFGLDHGIPVPLTVLTVQEAQDLLEAGSLSWPVVVKPRKGSASANISFCKSLLELRSAFESCPEPMIQESLPGTEYGYDIFSDQQFRPVSVYCKQKLAMRAGETDKAVSVDDPHLIALGLKIAGALELFGPMDTDVKLGADGMPRLLELNPRFGGGYPCSHLCGANFPRKLVEMCRGQVPPSDLDAPRRPGTVMLKQDEIICRTPQTIAAACESRTATSREPLRILFASAGRRVSLLREFRRAANDLNVRLLIHAVDCQSTAPALHVADESAVVVPIGPGYVSQLIDYCRQHSIDALVPLIDTELQMLSEARRSFSDVGTRLVMSSPEVIRISLDKVLTTEFLSQRGFRTPRLMGEADLEDPRFPLFMKPKVGSSSRGARRIENLADLNYYRLANPNFIVQEYIDGTEYTVDVFCDFQGRPRCAVPRMRREVRGGEVSKGQAVMHERMIEDNCRLVRELGGCLGMMTIQCFLTPTDEIVFTEINSRFGGGVPLSIRAGADSPRWLLELLLGREPSISMNGWVDGMLMLRYDNAFFLMPRDLLDDNPRPGGAAR